VAVVLLSLFRLSSFCKLFEHIQASVKIMEMEKYEVWVLLRQYWKQNWQHKKNVMLKAKVL
jgi:hypothetical protein